MDEHFAHFKSLLDREDREGAVNYVIGSLQRDEVDIVTLYEQIIGPAINDMTCSIDGKWCIWKEHVRTSIAATVLGCCYPYVMRERRERHAGDRGKVIIACPPEEYHEIGARMVADLFTLCGHEVTFIGANTPNLEVATAVEIIGSEISGDKRFQQLQPVRRRADHLIGPTERQWQNLRPSSSGAAPSSATPMPGWRSGRTGWRGRTRTSRVWREG